MPSVLTKILWTDRMNRWAHFCVPWEEYPCQEKKNMSCAQ